MTKSHKGCLGWSRVVVCIILIPLQLYLVASDPAEARAALSGAVTMASLVVLLCLAGMGVIICLRFF